MKLPVIRKRKEKGATLILGTVSMLFIIPMMGLAIDVGFMYSVKSKLQSAVDGAALAAARALSIGSSLTSQTSSAQSNAVTWFNANFPSGYFGTTNTVMGTGNVQVYAGTGTQAQVRNVTVTGTTQVSALFMRWLGFTTTTISATGNASRRTVVAMLVLDRSGSMCWNGTKIDAPCTKTQSTYPCADMINAAKLFTGQFAEGSDYIGLVSFSDSAVVQSAPVQNFQSVLGYSNSSGSSTGLLDNIGCDGGTGTAQGISLGYQLLYQTNLPGALNVIMLETDGLPNTLTMNFWDSTNKVPGLQQTSGCQDNTGQPYYTSTTKNGKTTTTQTGFLSSTAVPKWTNGLNMTSTTNGFLSSNSYYSNIPAGMIAAVSSSDPGDSPEGFWEFLAYFQLPTSGTSSDPFNSYTFLTNTGTESTTAIGDIGCANDGDTATPKDAAWFPSSDVYSNSLNPSAYTYQTVTTDGEGHITQSGTNPGNWSNYHAAVLNATDNSAYNARINTTIPATVFAIGLGGNSVNGPPNPVLLQRMANDPNGDEFNTTGPDAGGAYYLPCSQETACATWSSQPQGTFIYAPSTTYLAEAFLRISSQVLRLSK